VEHHAWHLLVHPFLKISNDPAGIPDHITPEKEAGQHQDSGIPMLVFTGLREQVAALGQKDEANAEKDQ